MTKGQSGKLEKAKKKGVAKSKKPALPSGWIQGDFLPSTVRKDDLLDLVEHDMLMDKSWRLPGDEAEPQPREGEQEWTDLHSSVPNGNTLDLSEGSMEDSAETEDYVNGSEETKEEESEESEEEDLSPSRPEPRTKQRHDPAGTPSKPLATSGRIAKPVRGSSGEPVELPTKVSKPSGPKPWKALPRMRIALPVAST
ncbi:hypothetical protein ZWY2020_006229 [Hordeum vulgare]|nr:hypothetical protein ZWY2020_006229 [Hordeum vulgare]